jgi:hypothetical protein
MRLELVGVEAVLKFLVTDLALLAIFGISEDHPALI